MRIEQMDHGSVRVLLPFGPITEDEVASLRHTVENCPRGQRFVLSLREVPYLDSRGIELMVDLADEMVRGGSRLRLAEVNETCREIFELTDVIAEFDIYDTIDDAVRSFL